MERTPSERENNFGVLTIAIQVTSPQTFMLKNLAEVF